MLKYGFRRFILALAVVVPTTVLAGSAPLILKSGQIAQAGASGPLTINGATTINNGVTVNDSATSGMSVVQTGGSNPAYIGTNNLNGAWPAAVFVNPSTGSLAQTQVFWERNDAAGALHIWQIAMDVNSNAGWPMLFNIEAVEPGTGVISTPISMARTGEVGIDTGVPVRGQMLTIQGTTGTTAIKLTPITVSTLPSCTGKEGLLYAVSDATSTTFHATIGGGGSNHVLAYCDGTKWTVH